MDVDGVLDVVLPQTSSGHPLLCHFPSSTYKLDGNPLCELISEPLVGNPSLEFTVEGTNGISKTYRAFQGHTPMIYPNLPIPLDRFGFDLMLRQAPP